ncbi:hypothetical protein KKG90_05645 [Candidatus Bipolaricaulota bacterium]|nr:hypothetical protein [Candidatus Bipolaricaulota bacterium]
MGRGRRQDQASLWGRLGEDWISVIVGLAVVLFVWLVGFSSIPWPLFGVFK